MLLPYIDWALATEAERHQRRNAVGFDGCKEFYDAILPHAGEALTRLNEKPLGALLSDELRLLHMCLSLAEVSATVEMYEGKPEIFLFPMERFVPLHDGWEIV
jgi:hypothetical protein